MTMPIDTEFSLVRVFGAGLKVECSSVAVLCFPSLRFFPLGFSWEGFLRRQDRWAVYTPMMPLRDDFEALCTLKWFGGNKESKKMQKTIPAKLMKKFDASSQEGLDKTYDRNKYDLDTLSMDDLYNNMKVYESEIKGKSSVSAASSKDQASTASYVDDVMFPFFSNQSNALQLDYEDLE
ncbi:hypothetical protein Tco_0828355 [Tanacetum coccineum]